jgi:phosphoribosyl-AMP cyclohydrolase / phosphoribosyl-ATP pyrophosphohydrolase
MTIELNFEKGNGLIPAVIQDARTSRVLMLGFMDSEAYRRTMAEGQVVFRSRSRNSLWKKGETSGNVLNVVSVHADCDRDTLLIRVSPAGPVCHTGTESCFDGVPSAGFADVIGRLFDLLSSRKREMPDGSYSADLFRLGAPRIGQKVGEEGVELAIAAQYPDTSRCIEESADLLYHLLVLLIEKGCTLEDVASELKRRER